MYYGYDSQGNIIRVGHGEQRMMGAAQSSSAPTSVKPTVLAPAKNTSEDDLSFFNYLGASVVLMGGSILLLGLFAAGYEKYTDYKKTPEQRKYDAWEKDFRQRLFMARRAPVLLSTRDVMDYVEKGEISKESAKRMKDYKDKGYYARIDDQMGPLEELRREYLKMQGTYDEKYFEREGKKPLLW